ncbi:hypothetical protein ABK040_002875 [Willaertia magna]
MKSSPSNTFFPLQKLVLGELNGLIIALRNLSTNNRFSNRYRFQYEVPRTQENGVMVALKDLRDKVSSFLGWQSLSTIEILTPFFTVIKSEDTEGRITALALHSIQKFLEFPCITAKTEGAKYCIQEIMKSVQQCQFEFEVSDESVEAVLIQILQTFLICVKCESGVLLDENNIVEILKSCLRIGRETRPTEILRKAAEHTLHDIISITFKRIRDNNNQEEQGDKIFEFICNLCDPDLEGKSIGTRFLGLSLSSSVVELLGYQIPQFPKLLQLCQNQLSRCILKNSTNNNVLLLSYTLKLMNGLIYTIRPYLHEQIEAFLLSTHIRIAEQTISLMNSSGNSTPNSSKANSALSFELQEIILENLLELCRDPELVVFLYQHYDCSEFSSNLFETIWKFFARYLKENDSPGLNTLHILALQGLLSIVRCLAERCQENANNVSIQANSLDFIRQRKEMKKKMLEVTITFNNNPVEGVHQLLSYFNITIPKDLSTFFISNSTINNNELIDKVDWTKLIQFLQTAARTVTTFLRDYGNWLDKAMICEYFNSFVAPSNMNKMTLSKDYSDSRDNYLVPLLIATKNPFTTFPLEVMRHFMESFDFRGMRVDEALRFYIHRCKISGEGQQVERVLRQFGTSYFRDNKDHFEYLQNEDQAWILAVAVIMLHTDLHHRHNKGNRMTIESFISMGNNSEITVPRDELEKIYHFILTHEFEVVANISDAYKSDSVWNEILERSSRYYDLHFAIEGNGGDELLSKLQPLEDSSVSNSYIYDMDLFQSMWGHMIMGTTIVLENTEDMNVLEMSIRGFLDSARVAAAYHLSNVFDNLVITLCKFTDMLQPHSENAIFMFGNNEKAKLACRTVFAITRKYGDNLREGWKNILDLICRMYELDLLPESLTESRDSMFVTGTNQVNSERKKKSSRGSTNKTSTFYLFSMFGAYSTNEDDNESLEMKQALEESRKCIEQCRIAELLVDAKDLNISSLEFLISALIRNSRPAGVVILQDIVVPNITQHLPKKDSTSQQNTRDLDTAMFCLDLLTDISITNRNAPVERLKLIWNYVYSHLYRLMVSILQLYENTNNNNNNASSPVTTPEIVLENDNIFSSSPPQSIFGGKKHQNNSRSVMSKHHHQIILRTIISVLRLCIELFQRDDMSRELFGAIILMGGKQLSENVMVLFHTHLFPAIQFFITKHLTLLKQYHNDYISFNYINQQQNNDSVMIVNFWESIFRILKTGAITNQQAHVAKSVEVILQLFNGTEPNDKTVTNQQDNILFVVPDNIPSAVQTLVMLVTAYSSFGNTSGNNVVTEALLYLENLITKLFDKAVQIAKTKSQESDSVTVKLDSKWINSWLSILDAISLLCCTGGIGAGSISNNAVIMMNRDVRTQALSALQRTLILSCDYKYSLNNETSNHLLNDELLVTCVEHVLLNNFLQTLLMLKPKTTEYQSNHNTDMDLSTLEELRVRANNLLARVFLHFLPRIHQSPQLFYKLWSHLLQNMYNFLIVKPKGDHLREAIPELMKNMILVMNNSDVFKSHPDFWEQTEQDLQKFLPELIDDVKPRVLMSLNPATQPTTSNDNNSNNNESNTTETTNTNNDNNGGEQENK